DPARRAQEDLLNEVVDLVTQGRDAQAQRRDERRVAAKGVLDRGLGVRGRRVGVDEGLGRREPLGTGGTTPWQPAGIGRRDEAQTRLGGRVRHWPYGRLDCPPG